MRWYSPRDYVEEVLDETGNVVVKGGLSARMKIPGNMWAEVWETARAIPARRQKRLFDDTKEAEKVIFSLFATVLLQPWFDFWVEKPERGFFWNLLFFMITNCEFWTLKCI